MSKYENWGQWRIAKRQKELALLMMLYFSITVFVIGFVVGSVPIVVLGAIYWVVSVHLCGALYGWLFQRRLYQLYADDSDAIWNQEPDRYDQYPASQRV